MEGVRESVEEKLDDQPTDPIRFGLAAAEVSKQIMNQRRCWAGTWQRHTQSVMWSERDERNNS